MACIISLLVSWYAKPWLRYKASAEAAYAQFACLLLLHSDAGIKTRLFLSRMPCAAKLLWALSSTGTALLSNTPCSGLDIPYQGVFENCTQGGKNYCWGLSSAPLCAPRQHHFWHISSTCMSNVVSAKLVVFLWLDLSEDCMQGGQPHCWSVSSTCMLTALFC